MCCCIPMQSKTVELSSRQEPSSLSLLYFHLSSTSSSSSSSSPVTLRPTVCRPVRLGAGPAVGPVTTFLISLFDNYFLSSRCRATSAISPMNRAIQPGVKVTLVQCEIFNVTIRKAAWEALQCNVDFGYQLSICSGTKENHGKPWSGWPVAGPSECNWLLASSPANTPGLALVPICDVVFLFYFSFLFLFFNKFLLCAYDFYKHQTVYNTCGRNKCIYEQICIQIFMYLCM
jgi:hypothetical protein